ncbi:MAG: hypothetical protein ACI9FU_002036, partial [Granulosicoccus sp.]
FGLIVCFAMASCNPCCDCSTVTGLDDEICKSEASISIGVISNWSSVKASLEAQGCNC